MVKKKLKTKIDLAALVKEFVQFISVETESLNIELLTQFDDDLYIIGDSDKVKQILSNLYNNSKEELESQSGKIKISVLKNDDKVVLSFEDSGQGIAPELTEKVFTPYYTTKEAGTGLGLPTVYKIVAALDGEIAVSVSDLGGAKFSAQFDNNQ